MISVKVAASTWNRYWEPGYGFAVIIVAAAAWLAHWLDVQYGVKLTYITFYPAIMLVAIAGNLGPGILATLLSAFCADYFFLAPRGQIGVTNVGDIIGLVVFLSMGLLISALAEALHRIRERERTLIEQALRDSEGRFRMVVDRVEDVAIFMLDAEGRVVSWNSGAERIKGWSASEILGQNFSLSFPEAAVNSGLPLEQLKIAAAEGCFRAESERVRKDGSPFWAEVSITALHDPMGRPRGYVCATRDISERKRAIRDMTETRLQHASVVESAMDAIITVDSDQRIVVFNAAAVAMFGWPATEALGKPLDQLIPQRFREAHAHHHRNFAASGVTGRTMGQLGILSALKSNGEEFPIEASISQANVGGRKLFTVILRDITARKQAEEHQALLLGELAHRVKNTLAIVQSIAAQTRWFATPEQFHDTFTGRLAALATAHDLLTRSEWEGAALAEVVRFAFGPYDSLGTVQRWTIEGPGIWLAPNEAVTLSLVVHELVTNAVKFGALSDANGQIEVGWHPYPEVEPTAITIHWRERGGPAVCPPSRRGFGSRLLDRAVAHELGGETTVEFAPAGVECWLRVPLTPKIKVQP
jgi:PAS domain S-box-containing protein